MKGKTTMLSFEQFPEELKQIPHWILWRKEIRQGEKKPTKVPYSAVYNGKAKSTEPKSWTTFEKALQALNNNPEQFSGLGFVFSEDDPFVFIDCDNCVNAEGELTETASEILDAFSGCYAELSQSGSGIHVIVKGNIPRGFNNRETGVEMYGKEKFCALTGNVFLGSYYKEPAADIQKSLTRLFHKYRTADSYSAGYTRQTTDIDLHTDFWIIEQASKAQNGEKFKALYAGNWEEITNGDIRLYPSQSEAEQALCDILAFWTCRNPEQIDRIFRSSGLYREKWNREDYSSRTVSNAINKCGVTLAEYSLQQDFGKSGKIELSYTKAGDIKSTYLNTLKICEADPELLGKFRYNKFTEWAEYEDLYFYVTGSGRIDAGCVRAVREYLATLYGIESKDHVEQALLRSAEKHPYNPVIDYMEHELPTWDGIDRFSTYMAKYHGCDKDEYTTEVLEHLLYGILNRTYNPGCKFDECVVLIGQTQGTGKSTQCRLFALKPEWFYAAKKIDSSDRGLTRFYDRLQGCLVVELEEMACARGVEIEVLKGIISEQCDSFDRKYHQNKLYPRKCVFIGTTNRLDALPRDETGNRRFLPLLVRPEKATARPYNEKEHREETLQLFAQALVMYKAGILPARLSDEAAELAKNMQERYAPEDANAAAVESYVRELLQQDQEQPILLSTLTVYNACLNTGYMPVKALNQKTQRLVTRYLDSCKLLQRYSGSKDGRTRISGKLVIAWEIKR